MNRRALAFFLGGLCILFAVYFLFRFRGFIRGPSIAITQPEEGATLMSGHVVVRGTARDVRRLLLDGRPIYVNDKNTFEELLLLPSGLNIIELEADGRFGRALEERRMILIISNNET